MAILFDPGQVVTTRGINDRMYSDADFHMFVLASFSRHVAGDWGDMCDEDKFSNDEAVKDGHLRIFSAYIYAKGGTKIWIITEADRSATTVLFPDEY